jgi:hypothetical protein
LTEETSNLLPPARSTVQINLIARNLNTDYGHICGWCDKSGAGTDSNIYFTLYGTNGTISEFRTNGRLSGNAYERNDKDVFVLYGMPNIGKLTKIMVRSDEKYLGSDWHLSYVSVNNNVVNFNQWIKEVSVAKSFP